MFIRNLGIRVLYAYSTFAIYVYRIEYRGKRIFLLYTRMPGAKGFGGNFRGTRCQKSDGTLTCSVLTFEKCLGKLRVPAF
jgi:hypothetical protein